MPALAERAPHFRLLLAATIAALVLGCDARSSSRKRYEALQQRERTKVDQRFQPRAR